ncbi:MAG TPA: PH domain-containing protein [Marmoricola sp.]|jgi:membrane protein YdbS with pleckstrin-like domain|nr:PH domain-containing protein [Marmoricola sp.]
MSETVTLREPAGRVSPRAPLVWACGAVVRSVLLAAGLFVATVVVELFTLPAWLWIGYVVLVLAYAVGMPAYRYRVHRWEATSTAVYTQTGWLARERRIAPMSRVQTVDLQQTAISRLFGLANVTVTTASAAGPLRIEALDVAVAERLVDELTRRTEAEAGDAT